jgi:hypothetical protein
MLTEEALRERKWGRFPALRKALEDKCIPNSYYGPTSVSDNVFGELNRLVEIAILAREHQSVVRDITQSVGREQMYRDLLQLRDDLGAASSFFKQQAEAIEAVCANL